MKYDTVIFDLDGTLLDTLDDLKDSVNFSLSNFNFPERSREEVRAFVGNGITNLISRSVPEGTDEETEKEALSIFKKHYSNNLKNKTAPYNGITDLLKELKARQVKTAVVSNKFDAGVKELCEYYFPGLVCAAVGESETVKRKPAPDSALAALKQLGSSAEKALYVGDSDVDIKTAKNAGVKFIGVSWGFRSAEFLRENGAETVVDEPDEILKFL
jgi:phosphoglycolate phosphatase